MIYKAGAGPIPIPHKQLNVQNLKDAIMFAISPSAKDAAEKMAQQIHEDVNIYFSVILTRPSEQQLMTGFFFVCRMNGVQSDVILIDDGNNIH